jgi:peptidoglycan/LPS O-acetylase OafA/YrhL
LHDAALTPAFVAIIYGLALRPAWSRVFEIAPLVLLGEASYSFYLLHSNILGWVFQPTGEQLNPSILRLIIGILAPIGVALSVYRWIEQPMRRRLRGKQKAAQELIPAAAASA